MTDIQCSKWWNYAVVVITMMCIVGCSGPFPETAETLLPEITSSSTVSISPSPEWPTQMSPAPSATLILTPSPSPTTCFTHTPRPTPRPTLTADEEYDYVRKMLATNGECELPCWWGITPGETSRSTVRDWFIATDGLYFELPHSERPFDYYISQTFSYSDGLVESITVMGESARGYAPESFPQDWQRYAPEQVLTRYGKPSQVYLHLMPPIEANAPVYYTLWLVYDQLGFYILYEGPAVYATPFMRACLDFVQVNRMILQLQVQKPDKSVLEEPELLVTLDEATGMDVETFYELWGGNGNEICIESPTDLWP